MQISSTSSNSHYANMSDIRMTVSCPPETFEDTVPSKQVKKEISFVIQRPERPGETHSHHGSKRSSVSDSEEYDDFPEEETRMRMSSSVMIQMHIIRIMRFVIRMIISSPQLDPKVLRRREKKWIQMLDNWRYFMDEKFELVKARCRKGIPPSLRGRAWKYLCGATFQMEVSANRFVFDYCVKQAGDPKWNEDIQKDLSRQFPEHEMFARVGKFGNNGKNDLFDLLKAWTVLHPEEGYCQGQAPIAAVLLMHMPVRDAFYCFVQICHKYLPGYYSSGLEAVQVDGDILVKMLKEKSKLTYRHFKQNGVDPALYMIEWFMCVFCRTLPWPTVLRVWDMFLCEGVKILFKVSLILLKYGLGTPSQIKQFPDMPAIVTRLRNLPAEIKEEEFIVQKISEMTLNDVEMEKMHFIAMKTRQMRFD
ncbi:Protein CBG15140 [Caenorhabditis briggsae]|uniref:Protein CBG15140 n=1 Tax=Caenorhabditis briggsae TaxID=6238 RepID=A8XLV0_CAEBR|nr:Protein CBG15140 [Caenorhabditis briggsae]CAP33604.2 Protein CBG15140 [Caenorhabditis briggsae]